MKKGCVWGNSHYEKLWDHFRKREKLDLGSTKQKNFIYTTIKRSCLYLWLRYNLTQAVIRLNSHRIQSGDSNSGRPKRSRRSAIWAISSFFFFFGPLWRGDIFFDHLLWSAYQPYARAPNTYWNYIFVFKFEQSS